MMRKKAFTLVEMLIVVSVVGLLLLTGVGLNRSQLQTLRATSSLEEFKGAMDQLYTQVLNTNIIPSSPGEKWENLTLDFDTQKGQLSAFFTSLDEKQNLLQETYQGSFSWEISNVWIEGQQANHGQVVFTPFSPECQVLDLAKPEHASATYLTFMLKHRGGQSCFQLQWAFCKVKASPCPEV